MSDTTSTADDSTESTTDREQANSLDLGQLYWNTQEWKTYAPYKRDGDLVYMVTVRRASEIADGLETGLLAPHDRILADSKFDQQPTHDSFRTEPSVEAERLGADGADDDE